MIRASWSRLWRHRGLILVWWLAGLMTAFITIVPLRATLAAVFGESLAEVELRTRLEVSHLVDLMSASPGAMPAIGAAFFGGLVAWLFLSSALSAGTLGVLCEGPEQPGFGASLTRWWGTFLRLEVIALLLIPAVAVAPILARVAVRVAGGETPPEPLEWWGQRASLVLAVMGLTVARLAVRFGRISAVQRNHQRAWWAFREGLRELRRWWWQGLLLALATGAVAAGVLIAENRLASALVGSAGAIAALFVGQQLLVLIRTSVRLWRTAAEVELAHRSGATSGRPNTVPAGLEPDDLEADDLEPGPATEQDSFEPNAGAAPSAPELPASPAPLEHESGTGRVDADASPDPAPAPASLPLDSDSPPVAEPPSDDTLAPRRDG